ncbi:MAG: hypothetical protein RIE74_05160 [Pseudomonadales bacterium]
MASPSGAFLMVSQFGDLEGGRAGSLVAYDPATGDIRPLFPAATLTADVDGPRWGDAACPPPPLDTFAPHGIDIERLDSGAHALYVVNHGGRESVEMFEVADDGVVLTLRWRGCVLAPEQGFFNDLVVLRDGGFWVSQMFPRDANMIWTLLRMRVLGHTPGFAYHWQRGRGFQELPGTRVAFANGIEKSADERLVFLNSYFGDSVIRVDTATGEETGRAPVSSPDNVSWSPTGELLVASHHGSLTDTLACQSLAEGSCGFRFQIIAIDPDTMAQRLLLEHEGPPMGAATVALPLGDQVYLGTFAGDRIARFSSALLARPEAP